MPACEKCWSDAHYVDAASVTEAYERLIEERKDNPCTPEEQCGEMHLLLDWTDRPRQCRCGKRLADVEVGDA